MSSIPAGYWANPELPWDMCGVLGCDQPATWVCWVLWHASGELSLQLPACPRHTDLARQSWLQGTTMTDGSGELQEAGR